MVVSVGRVREQEAISYRSWSDWLVDGDVPAARCDDHVAVKDDDPCRFRQIYWMGERVPSVVATAVPVPSSSPPAGDHWAVVP
jgi:hypothetical protein